MKTVHSFSVDIKTPYKRYEGPFTCKKLSIRETASVGVRKAQLTGGYHYDADNPGSGIDYATDELNAIIAHLELAIIDAPTWWDLDEIADIRVVRAVYQEVLSFEMSFLGLGEKAPDRGSSRGSEADSPKTETRPDTNRPAKVVVDEEVQSSLEP